MVVPDGETKPWAQRTRRFGRAHITIRIGNVKSFALLDTGADRNVMSATMYNDCFKQYPLSKTKARLYSFINQQTDCLGTVLLPVGPGDVGEAKYQVFYIVEGVKYPLLLGDSFCHDFRVTIQYPGPTVEVDGEQTPSYSWDYQRGRFYPTHLQNLAFLNQSVCIEPLSIQYVDCLLREQVFCLAQRSWSNP
jgi:hypothetical protein